MTRRLKREVGLWGGVLLGLGSILGTGVFVSIGIAADVAGPAVVLAVVLAALVAACNALSSAQLAASHPVSGGSYEYGYQYINPVVGFAAGWTFLLAKSASAATAALGFSAYLLNVAGVTWMPARTPVALLAVVGVTALVIGGMRRSNAANAAIVSVTILALVTFALAGVPRLVALGGENLSPFFGGRDGGGLAAVRATLHSTALMFVAYTGYGRIATLGEEIRDPRHNIPRAIVVTLAVSLVVYFGVALVGVGSVGAERFAAATRQAAAPLEVVARQFGTPGVAECVAVGAMSAMLGVLLNLVLGLSRVMLAMGRRGDLPRILARVSHDGATPGAAVALTGAVVGAIVLIGDIRLAWSFSAFTVLLYYAITNLAALRMPQSERRYPRLVAQVGLVACLSLAFFVERGVWFAGLSILALGLIWHVLAQSRRGTRGGT
jgi:APA family basic amino acid/polyamine antiporter